MKCAIMVSTHRNCIDDIERGHYVLTIFMDCVHPFMYEVRQYHDVTEVTAMHVHGVRIAHAKQTIGREVRERTEYPAVDLAIEDCRRKMEKVIMEEFV